MHALTIPLRSVSLLTVGNPAAGRSHHDAAVGGGLVGPSLGRVRSIALSWAPGLGPITHKSHADADRAAVRTRRRQISAAVALAFAILFTLVVIEAAHEVLGAGGNTYSRLVDENFYEIVAGGAAILMFVRGIFSPREPAWILLGIGTFIWLWSLVSVSYWGASLLVADIFLLLWYPFAISGLVLLVHTRLKGFDIARWIDGIALALLVGIPYVTLVLQPVIDASPRILDAPPDSLIASIDFGIEPALDLLLLGAAVGVVGLAAFRPGRFWYLFSGGLFLWVAGDAIGLRQLSQGNLSNVNYFWPAGLLLVAYAAWQPRSVKRVGHPVGWRVVLLPVICQVVVLTTQIWGLVMTVSESERLIGVALAILVIVQLCVGRPRRKVSKRK